MKRTSLTFLTDWLNSSTRKPLVIRGARQVGKTWLVRHLAQTQNRTLIEVNFEKRPQLISYFTSNDPQEIILNLSAAFSITIDPQASLLFLDEIQAAPELLAKLRWFAEDMPELPVIAAGSLLEFVLAEHSFSMPVGRISYMHLEPLSFAEFLLAHNKEQLANYLANYRLENKIPEALHEQLITLFKLYILIGGMPQAVANWVEKKSLVEVNQIQQDLMATYRDDFSKYAGRLSIERLDEVIRTVPKMLGEKFSYTTVNKDVQAAPIKKALDLLCKARVCHMVKGCDSNGIPLEADINDKYFKVIFLDTGLCSAALGLSLDLFTQADDIELVNKGGIAEQVTGQLLRTIFPLYVEPALYYWKREKSDAEVDYVIQHKNVVVPVEVKAGTAGQLKSLHLFAALKKSAVGVRINSDVPSVMRVDTKDLEGNPHQYTLISIPLYLIGQLPHLLP
jgi:predicted AAA+ superfamily ATPase